MLRRLKLVPVLVLLGYSGVSAQTVRTLCASGCTYTLTEANLQTAINASVGGDSILLQENTTTDVDLTLPSHTGASMVTIRTGVTSTGGVIASSQFPAANVRMTPALATSSKLATLRAKTNNAPAIGTSASIGGNGYWTLKHLAFTGNQYGGEALVRLGSDNSTAGEQDSIARIPTNFTVEQVYIYGHPVYGQFRGIRIHTNNTTLKDSYIANIKSTSEGQPIWLNSFSTGLTISNNYVEGGTEGIMFGGAGGCCRPDITVASATSASSFTLSAHTDLFVGRWISVFMASTATEERVQVVGCGTTTDDAACTSNTITVSPALSGTPAVGADVDWGLVPSDILVEKNYVYKPPAWRNAIVGMPQSVEASSSTSGGTLGSASASSSYCYRVVARHPFSVNTMAVSAASAEQCATVASGVTTGKVTISWVAVANATEYRVYGRSSGGENMYWTVTAPTLTYVDTGTTGTTGTVPTGSGTTVLVKNIFELKNARRVTVNGNIFDGVWKDGQDGYPILFTPANTGDGNDSTTLENVTFTNNIIRNAAGVFQLMGRGGGTARTKNITVSNNLAYNIGTDWGVSARSMLVTTNGANAYWPNNTTSNGPLNVTFNHNTIAQTTGNSPIWFDLWKGSAEHAAENVTFTNNIWYKLGYGLTGANSCAQGSGCWTAHTIGTRVWGASVVADATCSVYPSGTFCPTGAALANDFVSPSTGNYALKSTSAYHNAGTDGADIGVNYSTLTALTNIALSGDNTGGTPVVPPSITTLSLAGGQRNATYSADISGTCPATPCFWSSTGTLPPGLTLSTISSTLARLSGTLTTAGTFTPTVTITDTGSRTGSQAYSITVSEVVTPPDDPEDPGSPLPYRPDRFGLHERVLFGRATDPITDGEPVRTGDLWSALECSSPVVRLLRGTSPTGSWRALAFKPSLTVTTIGTAGVVTYAASELIGGMVLRDPNGAGRSDVTPTATLIVAALPCAEVGDVFEFDIRNTADAAETITITAGSGVTLSGTMTIAQNSARRFRAVVTNVGTPAVTLYSMGSYTF